MIHHIFVVTFLVSLLHLHIKADSQVRHVPTQPPPDSRPVFTYAICNNIQRPHFTESIQLKVIPHLYLIDYMEIACKTASDRFTKFSATYYPSVPGYFIDSINGLAGNWADNKTYWRLLNNNSSTSVGASDLDPKPGDNVVFMFTKAG
ncbi:hypothetical protein ACF0H5_018218 [Mactra antiquata]